MADRIAETELAYDSIAEQYQKAASRRSPESEEFFARFVGGLGPRDLVADLGCGPGDDLTRLEAVGAQAIGLDRSVELLKLASNRRRIRGDLRVLPFGGGSLGGIWSAASLLHVTAHDLAATFAEWDRVLAPGGLVGITTSLGGDSGWESVPATGSRVPTLPEGRRRWFVHHHEERMVGELTARGWQVLHRSIRSGHRPWLQLIANKPA